MERGWTYRLVFVLALVGLGVYYAAPSFIYFFLDPEERRSKDAVEAALPEWLPEGHFNLGIDLQGGLHMVMGVDTVKAVQGRADRVADELVEAMKDAGTELEKARRDGEAPVVSIVLQSEDDWPKLEEILTEYGDTWEVRNRTGREVEFAIVDDFESQLRQDAVAQALKTLRNRIDATGVTEPEIRKRGEEAIMIQLAGLTAQEIDDVKENIIGRTAQLEFKVVDDSNDYFQRIGEAPDRPEGVQLQFDQWQGPGGQLIRRPYLESPDRDVLQRFLDVHEAEKPSDRVVGLQEVPADERTPAVYRTWLLERRTPLTGDTLANAFVAFDSEKNQYYVAMKFDPKGAIVFERLTTENTKRKMAIVLDDIVDSAPVIQGPIPNGNASINLGGRSQQEMLDEAKALTIVLKAGALPAPVFPQEERTVGATLGDDAVEKGKTALSFALVGVVVLMLVYYRLSGVIGVLALTVNLLLLFAGLSALSATLTLPGIAGLALTVGMAVDANIIQFERIREELRAGRPPRGAVDAGFNKAFSAILDANITTFIAAVILLQYGSGPIRGFATTLSLGVLINTLTAVVVPRLVFDWLTRGLRVSKVSI